MAKADAVIVSRMCIQSCLLPDVEQAGQTGSQVYKYAVKLYGLHRALQHISHLQAKLLSVAKKGGVMPVGQIALGAIAI